MKKFLNFSLNPSQKFNLDDASKWAKQSNGRSYKLVNPDVKADKVTTTAHIKVAANNKGYDPTQKLYIQGVANANIVDRVQERLDPVGLDLTDYNKNSVLLAHHSYYHPIGVVDSLAVEEDGVKFSAWIGNPEAAELTDMQREIRSLVAQGILKTVSVGFIPKEIRAPLFSDTGELQEPMVIEKWELLEISVVAVPCNQDSIFSAKSFANPKSNATVDSSKTNQKALNESIRAKIKSDAQDSTEVQMLEFDKGKFNRDQAVKWANDHEFIADKVDETENSYRLQQKDPNEFEEGSFKTIDISEGVKAVSGKPKTKEAGSDGNTDGGNSGGSGDEALTLLRGMSDKINKIFDMCQKMGAEEGSEAGSGDAGGSSDGSSDSEKRLKSMEDTIAKLSKGFELLAAKLTK